MIDSPNNQANTMLELREKAFDANTELLAVALGRPADEIERIVQGTETMDEDLEMKIRELAGHHGVQLSNDEAEPTN